MHSTILSSRLQVLGSKAFQSLELSPQEIRIYLTVAEPENWPERMQQLIPDLRHLEVDEEEL